MWDLVVESWLKLKTFSLKRWIDSVCVIRVNESFKLDGGISNGVFSGMQNY